MSLIKLLLLSNNENAVEGFFIENVFIILPFLLGLVIIYFAQKYFFNFKVACPSCGVATNLSRIKKNVFFNRFKYTEKIKKFNCRKCQYKFYVLKNAAKGMDVETP